MAGSSFSFRDDFPSSATHPRRTPSRSSAAERIGSEVSAARTSKSGLGGDGGGMRRHAQIDQVDPDLARRLLRALVAIELAEVDAADARVRNQFETVPAWRRRRVDLRTVDADAVLRRLQDGVRFGVYGGDAVTVLHRAADVLAVRQPADRAVVAGGEDGAVADDDGPHVLERT